MSQLRVAEHVVKRENDTPIGYVTLRSGETREVHAVRIDMPCGFVESFTKSPWLYLLGATRFGDPTCASRSVVGALSVSSSGVIVPMRPVAPVSHSLHATRPPYDADVEMAVRMLLVAHGV